MSTRKVEVSRTVETIVEANCDNCGASIPFVFPDLPVTSVNSLQGKNMLHIIFMGGYGEYIDGRCRFHMCRDCAVKLGEQFPKIQAALDKTEG
jgi:hypothetical protein